MTKKFDSIDGYIASFPKDVQDVLQQVRQAIKEAAPKADEAISYNMPAFKQNGNLVWFGAFKNHIGFYPRESAIKEFKDRLASYEVSKVQGTVKFSLDKPIPLDLIKEIVKFRIEENLKGKDASLIHLVSASPWKTNVKTKTSARFMHTKRQKPKKKG